MEARIFDSEKTSRGTDRKRSYISAMGVKDQAAMVQALKDISKYEPMIRTFTREYKYVPNKGADLSSEYRITRIKGTPSIMDRYTIRADEIRISIRRFCDIYKQIEVINVKSW